jgi:O-antigen ligase
VTALIGAAILASFSRGAWLGTLGALIVITFLAGPRSRRAATVGALLLAFFLVAGGASLLPAFVQERFTSLAGDLGGPDVATAFITPENFAIVERRAHWEAGLQMFAHNRALGVGLGNFNERYEEFNISPTFILSQGHAHNYYIHVAAEAGLVGLGAYLLLLATLALAAARALRRTAGGDPLARALVVAGLGVVTAVAIHNVFENLHVLSMGIQLSAAWALFPIAAHGFAAAPAAPTTTATPRAAALAATGGRS